MEKGAFVGGAGNEMIIDFVSVVRPGVFDVADCQVVRAGRDASGTGLGRLRGAAVRVAFSGFCGRRMPAGTPALLGMNDCLHELRILILVVAAGPFAYYLVATVAALRFFGGRRGFAAGLCAAG